MGPCTTHSSVLRQKGAVFCYLDGPRLEVLLCGLQSVAGYLGLALVFVWGGVPSGGWGGGWGEGVDHYFSGLFC